MNRPSGLQDTLTTSSPASPNSSTQTPKSLLETTQLCQSLSPSQHISVISMLITDTVHQVLPCTETNAETDWHLCKPSQLSIVYFSQIITSSCSRVQTSVPGNGWHNTMKWLRFTVYAIVRLNVYTDLKPFTCFGCVLLVEGGCSILHSCSHAHVACSVLSMPNTFCHTSITMSKNEVSLFSSQL